MEIKVVTWAKDSHGLFDYESRSINVKKCKIDKPCKILRKSTNLYINYCTYIQLIKKQLLFEIII